jgi:two-component system, NarL family, response regulator LiaR
MTIRILLADDHAIVREGLRGMLEREPDMKVIADVSNGRMAVETANQEKPDLVVMDVSMPDLNGIEATRQIISKSNRTKVICLSMHHETKFVSAMLRAGAMGYVLKNDVTKELINAIRGVMSGDTYLSPAITGDIVKKYIQRRPSSEKGAFTDLSEREREVLQLIAEGLSTKEIASKLDLSEKTVAAHREHIMAKLGFHNVVELTRYALREGISEL